jgi:hypothetical protein
MREQDETSLTSAAEKFLSRVARYTWQDYKTNEDI